MTFDQRLFVAIKEMQKFGYTPQYLINMISRYGAINAVKKLVIKPEISQGLQRLQKENALELSLESIILEPEWENIFTEKERDIAKKKLILLNNSIRQNGV
jgi:hypothetical protein